MKNRIVRVNFHHLRNRTAVQFVTEFIPLVEKYGAETLDISALYNLFKASSANVILAMEYILKSHLTMKLEEFDRFREASFRALVSLVRSFLFHPDPAKRTSANRLILVIDHYGDVTRANYEDESAAIDDLLRELALPENAPHVAALAAAPQVAQLADANARFFNAMNERTAEAEKRPQVSMRDARAIAEGYLFEIVARLEAIATLDAASDPVAFSSFTREYNAIATRYKHVMAVEKGRRKSSSTAPEEDEEITG
ncbi:MAG: DUF6261 family protein [Odoribacteraceae bacterium]|jgi:hypothetical protein|nr:DUF6261 family protein [Odoribacteraceae bacterium]